MAQSGAPGASTSTSKLPMGSKNIQISLLAKVLEQDNPIITSKMLPFLMQEGVAEMLVNFITRTDPSMLPQPAPETDEEALREKRAITAVALFEKSSPTVLSFLEKRADDMATSLFKVLEYLDVSQPDQTAPDGTSPLVLKESALHLWRRTLSAILSQAPTLSIEGLSSDHAFMTGAVRVLGHADVALGVLQVYSAGASQPALTRKLTWFTWLLSRQLFSDSPTWSACGELLVNLIYTYSDSLKNVEPIGQMQSQPHAGVHAFLQPFYSPEFLDNLSKSIYKGGTLGTMCADMLWKLAELEASWPARICAHSPALVQALSQLETKALLDDESTQDNSDLSTKTSKKKKKKNKNKGANDATNTPTPVTATSDTPAPSSSDSSAQTATAPSSTPSTPATSTPSSPTLTSEESTEPNTTKKEQPDTKLLGPAEKMSVVRCGVVRILATVSEVKVNGVAVALDALADDPTAWRVLASWFFRFPYANIYHQQFYSLLHTAITTKHWPTLKRVFIDNKLLSTLINHFLGTSRSGVRGYIFLIFTDLQELYTDSKTPATTPTENTTPRKGGGKKKDLSVSQENLHLSKFISFMDSHDGWKKVVPLLKVEVKWSTPPPVRDPAASFMMGEASRGRRGLVGFDRDSAEEVLLDMPKFRNLNNQ